MLRYIDKPKNAVNIENMEVWADKRLCSATLLWMTVTTYVIKKSTLNILDGFRKVRIVKTFSRSYLHASLGSIGIYAKFCGK